MTILPNNSAIGTIQFTKGTTFVLPIERTAGTALPDFTTLTWTGGIYTLIDETLVSDFTVTASDADNITVTISATITGALTAGKDKYGFNIIGTVGSTVYNVFKGGIIVHRKI